MSVIYTDKGIIKIQFPKKEFNKYIKNVGTSDRKKLTLIQTQHILLYAVRDFKSGKLSLDNLSEICGYLWHTVYLKKNMETRLNYTKLGDALYAGGELNYYVRNIQQNKGRDFIGFINVVYDFYNENKQLSKH